MEDKEKKKMEYINENIIEKGYSPEELSNFIIKTIGIPMESLPLEKLKEMVEEFKNKGLTETYKTIKLNEKNRKSRELEKEEIKKLNSPFYNLYLPISYEIETDIQQENKLLELHRNHNLIKIIISEPKKEGKKGIFSKTFSTYKIVKQIESLLKLENEEYIEERKMRYLQKFMDSIINRNILKTSPLLYEFLILDEELFKAYQKKINGKKYELSISLDNMITLKGKINCELKEDSIQNTNNNIKKYNNLSDVYNKLCSHINNIVVDFQSLNTHMKQLSSYFEKLNQYLIDYNCAKCDDMKTIYSNFAKIFDNWSKNFKKQSEYFHKDFKETFYYYGLGINEMNTIFKKYTDFKNEYETFTSIVNKKKEKLFTTKTIDKWGVEPGTEDDIPNYLDNKEVAFEKMLYKETILLREEKKRICATIYLMNKQFDKLLKNQNENIKIYYDSIIKNSKDIFGNEQLLNDLLEEKKE